MEINSSAESAECPCRIAQDLQQPSNVAVDLHRNETLECHLASSKAHLQSVMGEVSKHLPCPWIATCDEDGLHVLLLSRDREKSVQRRVLFTLSREEEISVHRKPLRGPLLQDIISPEKADQYSDLYAHVCSPFVKRVLTIVQQLKCYEVCVGVNDPKFRPLWGIDKAGQIDNNLFGELRYRTATFRPLKCDLLVSTAGYLRLRCPVCIKTTIRFRVMIQRHSSTTSHSHTPNVHLDRSQLLRKSTCSKRN